LNTKSQVFIDQIIARPIAYLINFIVRFVGKILAIDHRLDKPFQRIVVCKFKGLGSIIQATPLLQSLKAIYPNSELVFLSTKSNIPFLKEIDVIDTIIAIDDSSATRLVKSLFSGWRKLITKRPELYIDLEIYSNFSSLVAISTLAKNRVGYYLPSSSFKMGIYTHMLYFNTNLPVSEVYLQIARMIHGKIENKGLYPIYKSSTPHLTASSIQSIVVNPNASDLRIERRWSKENFRELGRWLCEHYPNKEIIYIGSASEKDYVDELLHGLSFENLKNFAGQTSVKELIQLIKNTDLVITNDTGPMHIAFACNTATVALFGPCSPNQYGSSTNTRVLYKQVYCSPCVHEFITPPCKGNNVCMQLISLQEVKTEIEQFFDNGKRFDSIHTSKEVIYLDEKLEVPGVLNRSMN
jgi:ADP-heptose:LPS heptosyltransferase